jgi:hypothetical protein
MALLRFGTRFTTPVTALSRKPGRIDLFCVGTDNQMYSAWRDEVSGAFDNYTWHGLRGNFASRPPVVGSANGIHLFCVGTDNNMYYQHWNGHNWKTSWLNLGGDFITAPWAISGGLTRIDVFCKGRDGQVYHLSWRDVDDPDLT